MSFQLLLFLNSIFCFNLNVFSSWFKFVYNLTSNFRCVSFLTCVSFSVCFKRILKKMSSLKGLGKIQQPQECSLLLMLWCLQQMFLTYHLGKVGLGQLAPLLNDRGNLLFANSLLPSFNTGITSAFFPSWRRRTLGKSCWQSHNR